jgi:hypothetical protein
MEERAQHPTFDWDHPQPKDVTYPLEARAHDKRNA